MSLCMGMIFAFFGKLGTMASCFSDIYDVPRVHPKHHVSGAVVDGGRRGCCTQKQGMWSDPGQKHSLIHSPTHTHSHLLTHSLTHSLARTHAQVWRVSDGSCSNQSSADTAHRKPPSHFLCATLMSARNGSSWLVFTALL